ncbi:nuclease [Cellulomonas xylanilytica]|uniref:Nuclease n=1 Tax=Cellulomonas xylanilytica TaxID=233583 RepID=A0A510V9P5_9CELL|nr:nuclease [Cellulomonas xylanilytica]GEK23589.1 hypothetical protein CXY01_41090 [Cellulomonas xylanilytica]
MPNRTRIDLLPIQEAVAAASPRAWRDGIVTASEPGSTTVALLDGGATVLTTRATPAIGEPVAVHLVAEVVALGGAWYAARPVVA